jgi:hypothetical protein
VVGVDNLLGRNALAIAKAMLICFDFVDGLQDSHLQPDRYERWDKERFR